MLGSLGGMRRILGGRRLLAGRRGSRPSPCPSIGAARSPGVSTRRPHIGASAYTASHEPNHHPLARKARHLAQFLAKLDRQRPGPHRPGLDAVAVDAALRRRPGAGLQPDRPGQPQRLLGRDLAGRRPVVALVPRQFRDHVHHLGADPPDVRRADPARGPGAHPALRQRPAGALLLGHPHPRRADRLAAGDVAGQRGGGRLGPSQPRRGGQQRRRRRGLQLRRLPRLQCPDAAGTGREARHRSPVAAAAGADRAALPLQHPGQRGGADRPRTGQGAADARRLHRLPARQPDRAASRHRDAGRRTDAGRGLPACAVGTHGGSAALPDRGRRRRTARADAAAAAAAAGGKRRAARVGAGAGRRHGARDGARRSRRARDRGARRRPRPSCAAAQAAGQRRGTGQCPRTAGAALRRSPRLAWPAPPA